MTRVSTHFALSIIFFIVSPCAFAAAAERPSADIAPFATAGLVDSWQFLWPREELGRSAALSVSRSLSETGAFEMVEAERPCASRARLGVAGSVVEYGLVSRSGGNQKVGKWEWGKGGGVSARVAIAAAVIDCASGRTIGRFTAEDTTPLDDASAKLARAEELDRVFLVRMLSVPAADLARQIAKAGSATRESGADAMGPTPSPAAGQVTIPPTAAPASQSVQDDRVGKIVKIDDANGDGERISIYVNLGSLHGAKEGSIFQVSRPGPPIVDPDTDEILGADEVLIGTLEVEHVLGEKLSRTRVASGSGFQIRDRVRPKE